MGVTLAIKRSYRYFLPQPFLSPRRFIRQCFPSLSLYVVGLFTGMYGRPVDPMRITYSFLIAMVGLIAVKWWAGASAKPPEA